MKHSITVNRTAHYHTLGDLNNADTVWFVLHGYGMLPEFFINKFKLIANEKNFIVAPEGLSKFYLEGFSGKIGANWMTKDSREDEINDYINYLNQLYDTLIGNHSNIKVNVLGFSQGGATASRWVENNHIACNNLILWSSTFPKDIDLLKIEVDQTYIACGTNDEFITQEYIHKQQRLLNAAQFSYELIEFDGPHNIPPNVLSEVVQKYNW